MDIIEYLQQFSKELAGLNSSPAQRKQVLRFVRERLLEVLAMVEKELDNGVNSSGARPGKR